MGTEEKSQGSQSKIGFLETMLTFPREGLIGGTVDPWSKILRMSEAQIGRIMETLQFAYTRLGEHLGHWSHEGKTWLRRVESSYTTLLSILLLIGFVHFSSVSSAQEQSDTNQDTTPGGASLSLLIETIDDLLKLFSSPPQEVVGDHRVTQALNAALTQAEILKLAAVGGDGGQGLEAEVEAATVTYVVTSQARFAPLDGSGRKLIPVGTFVQEATSEEIEKTPTPSAASNEQTIVVVYEGALGRIPRTSVTRQEPGVADSQVVQVPTETASDAVVATAATEVPQQNTQENLPAVPEGTPFRVVQLEISNEEFGYAQNIFTNGSGEFVWYETSRTGDTATYALPVTWQSYDRDTSQVVITDENGERKYYPEQVIPLFFGPEGQAITSQYLQSEAFIQLVFGIPDSFLGPGKIQIIAKLTGNKLTYALQTLTNVDLKDENGIILSSFPANTLFVITSEPSGNWREDVSPIVPGDDIGALVTITSGVANKLKEQIPEIRAGQTIGATIKYKDGKVYIVSVSVRVNSEVDRYNQLVLTELVEVNSGQIVLTPTPAAENLGPVDEFGLLEVQRADLARFNLTLGSVAGISPEDGTAIWRANSDGSIQSSFGVVLEWNAETKQYDEAPSSRGYFSYRAALPGGDEKMLFKYALDQGYGETLGWSQEYSMLEFYVVGANGGEVLRFSPNSGTDLTPASELENGLIRCDQVFESSNYVPGQSGIAVAFCVATTHQRIASIDINQMFTTPQFQAGLDALARQFPEKMDRGTKYIIAMMPEEANTAENIQNGDQFIDLISAINTSAHGYFGDITQIWRFSFSANQLNKQYENDGSGLIYTFLDEFMRVCNPLTRDWRQVDTNPQLNAFIIATMDEAGREGGTIDWSTKPVTLKQQ